jgi:signal transduction histidine kinase
MSRRQRLGLDAAVVILAVAVLVSALPGPDTARRLPSVALSALALLLFLGRRWSPVVVSLLAFAALGAGVAVPVDITPTQFFGILATFGLVGGVNRSRDAVLGWAAGVLVLGLATSQQPPGQRAGDFLLSLAFCSTIWAAGVAIARRGRHVEQAEDRARRAEETRAEHARAAIAAERARIAGELHDIVSHALSVVVVQTVAARRSPDGADVERRLAAVEGTAREALADMRRMLGLLQLDPEDEHPAIDPSPGLRHLPALLDRARETGMPVDLAAADTLPELTAGLDLTAYRVVQESLTNALKHAPGSAVRVRLAYRESVLEIEVVNSAPTGRRSRVIGAGRGLLGLRQRCALYGAELRAGPCPDGGFRVHARLPVSAPQPSPAVVERGS